MKHRLVIYDPIEMTKHWNFTISEAVPWAWVIFELLWSMPHYFMLSMMVMETPYALKTKKEDRMCITKYFNCEKIYQLKKRHSIHNEFSVH